MKRKTILYVVNIIKGRNNEGQPEKEFYKSFTNWKTAKAVASAIHAFTGANLEITKVLRKDYEAGKKVPKQSE